MRHALVTGGAGFIGSHLAEGLLERGCRVTVVDNLSTGRRENLAGRIASENVHFIEGDVGDAELVHSLLADVDEVYHLAAAVGVALIARSPIQTIETNIYPTQLILSELAERYSQGASVKFFLASTSEVYGKNPRPKWNEDEDLVLGPTNRARWSYGASKAIDEFLALAYFREVKLPVVVGRLFNVVGPRQSGAYGMVLPRFVEACLAGRPPVVYDDGEQVRCFAHVADVCGAIESLMETPSAIGQVFNIGSDEPVRIVDLARQVIAATNPALEPHFQSYAEAYDEDFEDVRSRVPDLSRLRQTINYQPKYDLAQTIQELVAGIRQS